MRWRSIRSGRLWVADRGNHRIEIFDQEGNYLESRYMYGRISGIYHQGRHGLRDRLGVQPDQPRELEQRRSYRARRRGSRSTASFRRSSAKTASYQGAAGEGVAVDADGNVYAAEGPNSLMRLRAAPFTKYSVK